MTLSGFSAAGDFVELGVPQHRNLGILEQPILQDLLGAEIVAPVRHRDLGGEVGQEQSLLDRGIAAAHHHHVLAAIEKSVAGGAGRDPVALEPLLRRQLQPARLRPGRDDERIGQIDVAGIAFEPERPPVERDLVDVIGHDPGAYVLGLLLHLLHQPGSLDDVGKARIVLDLGGDGELAARLDTLDEDGFQHRSRGVDGGRIAGRPGADDDDLGMGALAHLNDPWWVIGADAASSAAGPITAAAARHAQFRVSGELCKIRRSEAHSLMSRGRPRISERCRPCATMFRDAADGSKDWPPRSPVLRRSLWKRNLTRSI